jgi:hypothetical protein
VPDRGQPMMNTTGLVTCGLEEPISPGLFGRIRLGGTSRAAGNEKYEGQSDRARIAPRRF